MSQESQNTQATEERAEPGYVVVLRTIDNSIGFIEQVLLACFLVLLVGIGVAQAVMIKFGAVLGGWTFETLRYSVFFIAMTGAALSAHTGQLIAMDFVTRALSPMARARMQVVLRMFTVTVCVLLVAGGLTLAASVHSNPEATIDPKHGLMALPIGAGLMGVHVLLHLIIDLTYLVRGHLPPSSDAQGSVH